MEPTRAIKIDQYKSPEVRYILTELLFEFGVDAASSETKEKKKTAKKVKLKVVGSKEETQQTGVSLDEIAGSQTEKRGITDEKACEAQKPGLSLIAAQPLQVTVEDLLKYYKHKNIVGEEKNCILQTLCAANSLSFGIEGNSGSGKTFLVGALIDLLPKNDVYELGLASEQAPFHDSKRINTCRFIYIPEIQKAMNSRNKAGSIIELIKNLTEGKDASRIVTEGRGEVTEYRIKAGVTIIYTLALENCFKKDNETSRRFIRLMTDTSREHIDDVMQYKAEERCSINGEKCLSKEGIKRIKNHLKSCIEMPEVQYFDPFSITLNEYIPSTPKSIGFVNHYYGLLNACAKFHHKNRLFTGEALVLDFEDHYLVQTLYYDEFCRTLSQLNKESAGEKKPDLDYEPKEFDWSRFWNEGFAKMKEQLPDIADQWASKQLNEGKIRVYDVPSLQYTEIKVEKTVAENNET